MADGVSDTGQVYGDDARQEFAGRVDVSESRPVTIRRRRMIIERGRAVTSLAQSLVGRRPLFAVAAAVLPVAVVVVVVLVAADRQSCV